MAGPMLRHGLLFLCLLVTSLVTATTIHAREWPGVSSIECSGTLHSDGDADQSPGDADQAAPHHHGSCHGASFVPARFVQPMDLLATGNGHGPASSAALGRWTRGPDLRPPIA